MASICRMEKAAFYEVEERKSKYLNFPIEAADHRKLKLLCLHRDCTLKSILQEIVHSYVENAPEFKKEES